MSILIRGGTAINHDHLKRADVRGGFGLRSSAGRVILIALNRERRAAR
jgi:hypothetical protein